MSRNRILEEIEKRREVERESGEKLPMPSYLFISRYGRSIAKDFEKLKESCGYRDGFIFRVKKNGGSRLVHSFQMEAETNTQLGRKLQGLVLVDLGEGLESVEEQEIKNLLLYLKELEPDVHCMFTAEANKYTNETAELLKQYFFIRTVEGEAYDAEEELEILKEAFAGFRFALEPESEKVFRDFFETYAWDAEDNVENRLQNLVKNAVYDTMLKKGSAEEEADRIIDAEEAAELVRWLEKDNYPDRRRTVGFHRGGTDNE